MNHDTLNGIMLFHFLSIDLNTRRMKRLAEIGWPQDTRITQYVDRARAVNSQTQET